MTDKLENDVPEEPHSEASMKSEASIKSEAKAKSKKFDKVEFMTKLKRRQIFKVATIYAVTAWPLVQITDLLIPILGLPDSVLALVFQILLAGFPLCLMLAWLYNVTKHGIVRANSQTDHEETPQANVQTSLVVAGSMTFVIVMALAAQLLIDKQEQPMAAVPVQPESPRVTAAVDFTEVNENSIAILPFVPFTSDPDDEYFADGVVEELLNGLAKVPQLQVAARTSSFAYKGVKDKSITEIAAELGVAHVLEGSIRKNDTTNKIRVTAQLIKAQSGEHLWSETYDREYQDIFQIQDDIAKAVVEKMKVTLLGESLTEAESIHFEAPTSSVDAMVAYGKGQKELNHRTVISINNAIEHFQEAIRIDSQYARAYVGLADAKTLLALYGNVEGKLAREEALAALDKALVIDPKLGEAYATKGLIARSYDMDEAEQVFKKAMALAPNYSATYMWYGGLLQERGDVENSHKMYEKAYQLDPKSPVAAYLLANSYYMAGNESKTMELFTHIVSNDPYYPSAYNLVGEILLSRGRLDESISMFKRALDVDALNKKAVGGLIAATTDLGNYDRAEQWFEYASKHDELFDASSLNLLKFRYHLSQGQKHQAFDYLSQVSFDSEKSQKKHLSDWLEGEKAYYQGDFQTAVDALERMRFKELMKEDAFYRFSDGRVALHLAHAYAQLELTDKLNELLAGIKAFLDKDKDKRTNDPSYYYTMSMVHAIEGKNNEAFYYLQGAIDVGWVRAWEAEIEPIFSGVNQDIQFSLMMGGVKARLANMRVRMADEEEFMLAGSEEI